MSSAWRPSSKRASIRELDRRPTKLVDPGDVSRGDRLERDVAQRRATPQAQRLVEEKYRSLELAIRQCPATLRCPLLEPIEIELPGFHLDQVAGRPGDDARRTQALAQLRDPNMKA